ncbi:diguanylate cyclase [Pelotomaculum isophthalicicum JI]|uniref:Diguanylate cyclase n=1 Tax=Pelotomaculum isophthalicicum JI TaxID=947010 RepID=A0A9X4H368_9FIRM|nr:diguanylate cyclase [Pelotomaculum isophthalicicum]MDF9408896.1 diguanylate cyclase [Pelotomaculum isophthalicicum JI]
MISICLMPVRLVKQFIGLLNKNQILPGTMTRIRLELAGDINPLTGLSGNIALEQELRRRIAEKVPFCVVYVSLPHKMCRQKYGLSGGNRIILFAARLLANILKKYGGEKDFLAHIKGDNFIAIIEKERIDSFCERTVKSYDSLIMSLTEQEKRKTNRNLAYEQEDPPFLSMYVIDCGMGERINLKVISKKVEQLKNYSRSTQGSVWIHEPAN